MYAEMKKIAVLFMTLTAALMVQAEDYPYLTFEMEDGTKTSVIATPNSQGENSATLTITIQDGKLMAGSQEFTLVNLSKMYFSTSDETTSGIEEISITSLEEAISIYDLQGRKVSKDQMRRGIYVIKTKSGTRKVNVK